MYVDEFLKEHGIIKGDRYIVIASGTTWDTKNYPVVHWAKIINYLYEKRYLCCNYWWNEGK